MGAEQPGTGVLVRDPEALERQDQRIDRELGQQQKPDALGTPLLIPLADDLVAGHGDAPLRQLPSPIIKSMSSEINSFANRS